MKGPLYRYQEAVDRGEYQSDESQEKALGLLQNLHDSLIQRRDKKPGILSRLLGKSNPGPL